ncbi:hypothetical protein PHLGIDRAFT_19494 [Phlebiopsis gigantea 11061_1 CR5-6]|uniref:Uncharacterized protein n=1 Tax=Phlebiopsis gigantea (strain 11061_1 CR5-6) TaxID=745531 RepID=A0A0C3RWZ4_PHLG1|nr:hypothetical protein PHLGIDRAFT_19494 [Phlebiopsis gigantea 11061_1 CR5-6]
MYRIRPPLLPTLASTSIQCLGQLLATVPRNLTSYLPLTDARTVEDRCESPGPLHRVRSTGMVPSQGRGLALERTPITDGSLVRPD